MDAGLNSPGAPTRPTVGLTGSIGAGKSTVARMLGALGWCVSDSDQLARQALEDPAIARELARWWGPEIRSPDGTINRARVAAIVFAPPGASPQEVAASARERGMLEEITHPWIFNARQRAFAAARDDAAGFVIDAPLLIEAGLDRECTCVVFVDAPYPERLRRVGASRGLDADELARRESAQMPLDLKRKVAHHVLVNDTDQESLRARVARLHSLILDRMKKDSSARR